MSKWSDVDRRHLWRAMVVQEFTEHSALDYLAHHSAADPTEIQL